MRSFYLACLASASVAGAAHAQEWKYEEFKDPFTDAKRGVAYITDGKKTLAVKCDTNGPDVMYLSVSVDKYIGDLRNPYRNVIVRINDGELQADRWAHDDTTAILNRPLRVMSYVYQLETAKTIAIRLTTHDFHNVDAVFKPVGSSAPLRKAFATCGQDFPS